MNSFAHETQYQRTLAAKAVIDGFGFWTGEDVRVEMVPAPENSGVFFRRMDRADSEPVPARLEFRAAKPRQTSLERGDVRVDMVEHLLAAVRGAGIDNLEIRTNASEIPGFDGSATPFLAAIQSAGIIVQRAVRRQRIVRDVFRIGTKDQWIEIRPASGPYSVYRYEIDYPPLSDGTPNPIKPQTFAMALAPESFAAQIAPARTFLLESEAKQLLALGLCRRVSERDVLVFGPDGVIGNTLRFENESARHKVLDMIGDFSLTETPILAEITAHRTGHQQNAEALGELLEAIEPE